MTTNTTHTGTSARGSDIPAATATALTAAGAPYLLWLLAGNPLPAAFPTLDQVTTAVTTPDDGTLFLTALTWVGWLAWATTVLSILWRRPPHDDEEKESR